MKRTSESHDRMPVKVNVGARGVVALATAFAMLAGSAGVAMGAPPIVGPQKRIDTAGGVQAANETSASAADLFPLEVVGTWNDWRESTGSEIIRMGVAVTNNGGQTWVDFLVRPPAANQTSVEGDPMSAYDPRTGTLWVGAISFAGNGGVFVARKNQGANTFQPSVMARRTGGADKCWMAAGPDPANQNLTRVYVAYNEGSIFSTDMGQTWSNPVSLGSGIGFLPRVGPGGELYVAYWDFGNGVFLRRSFNGGVSFDPAIRIATRLDVWGTQDGSRFPGTFRVPSMNYIAVDPVTGVLYCVYFDTTNIVGGLRNVDLYFTKSTDRGTTWSVPRIINQDNLAPADQFFPWLEVDRRGRIHMIFYDTRHNATQPDDNVHGLFDCYYSYSDDQGTTWHESRLTPTSFDSENDGLNRGQFAQFLGDYSGLAVGGDRIYPCYLTTQNGDSDIYTNEILSVGLDMTAPAPGIAGVNNTINVTGAAAGTRTFFVYAINTGAPGSTPVPGCAGLTVQMANPVLAGSEIADGGGNVTFTRFVPRSAAGVPLLIQAVEPSTCSTSNLMKFTFQ